MGVTITTNEEELGLSGADEPILRERLALGGTPAALFAECTCPEWCEHDHENE